MNRIYLDANFRENKYSTASYLVDEFEKKLAEYFNIDKENLLVVNSGTSALHLSLIVAGIKPGDKVLLPALTFVATANVVKYIGAIPQFCDVDSKTWLMIQPEDINDYDYIMPVDLYGNMWIFNKFNNCLLSKKKFIYDCAESLGSSVDLDDNFYCYSFNGNKLITTGAGGMIVSNKSNIKKLKKLSMQGKSFDYYDSGLHDILGYNYRMSGVCAKIGISQLKYTDKFLKRKKQINNLYRKELSNILEFQEELFSHTYWMTAALFPECDLDFLKKILAKKNIPTRRIFRPLNHHYHLSNNEYFKNAEMIYNRGLCLPSSTLNTDDHIYYVCQTIKEILGEVK